MRPLAPSPPPGRNAVAIPEQARCANGRDLLQLTTSVVISVYDGRHKPGSGHVREESVASADGRGDGNHGGVVGTGGRLAGGGASGAGVEASHRLHDRADETQSTGG